MTLSGKSGGYAAALCILALVTAACMSPASPGSATQGFASGGTPADPAQEHEKNRQNLPPDAAVAACSGKISGDVCQFTDREVTVSGTCDEKPGVLSCAPGKSVSEGQAPEPKITRQLAISFTMTQDPGSTPTTPTTSAAGTSPFVLASDAGADGGTLPDEYSCDEAGASPALFWTGAPAGKKEFALMMTTVPVDGSIRWNWVLYHIPATATRIVRNGSEIGTLGTGSHGTVAQYDPPCSQGPGAKLYTFTLYALSASPDLPANPEEVTGPVLTGAISSITLDKAVLNLNHARAGTAGGSFVRS